MARRVFFSFHFDNDFWRAQQVRNIGALEGQPIVTPNAWEEVKRKGDRAIENWIHENMKYKECVVVLVGAQTASRPWVKYEIAKGWADKRGVLGIRIHKLLNEGGRPGTEGPSPFGAVNAPLKTPPGLDSKAVYASIS